jgi:hypothetical protein
VVRSLFMPVCLSVYIYSGSLLGPEFLNHFLGQLLTDQFNGLQTQQKLALSVCFQTLERSERLPVVSTVNRTSSDVNKFSPETLQYSFLTIRTTSKAGDGVGWLVDYLLTMYQPQSYVPCARYFLYKATIYERCLLDMRILPFSYPQPFPALGCSSELETTTVQNFVRETYPGNSVWLSS